MHVNWHVETYAIQKRLNSWKTDAAGGGMLLSFIAHCLHYLPWLAGPIDRLRATLHRQADDPGNADTMDQLEMHFRSGAYGTVTASCNAPSATGHRIEIYGEDGSICLENRTRDYLTGFTATCASRDGPVPVAIEPVRPAEAATMQDGRVRTVSALMRQFIDWIEKGEPAGPDFQEGRKSPAVDRCGTAIQRRWLLDRDARGSFRCLRKPTLLPAEPDSSAAPWFADSWGRAMQCACWTTIREAPPDGWRTCAATWSSSPRTSAIPPR